MKIMMKKKWFIMMYNFKGDSATPLVVADETFDPPVAFFKSLKEAMDCAEGHAYCQAFGYKILKMD